MRIILDGKTLAEKITKELSNKVSKLEKKPKLAVVIVGNNPASEIYVRNKQLKAESIGFESLVLPLPEDISEENTSGSSIKEISSDFESKVLPLCSELENAI